MGQQFFRLVLLLTCLLAMSESGWATGKGSAPEWQGLTSTQQSILAPVAAKWPAMSSVQRARLLAVAAKYPKLNPEEQKRFKKRLATWTSLTREQRNLARLNYKKLKQLPPKKQLVVKQKWLEKQHGNQPGPVLVEQTPLVSQVP